MRNHKNFGVWMDTQSATIVGHYPEADGPLTVIAHVKTGYTGSNSNEHTGNNHEISTTAEFFKEIAKHMPNVDALHLTGTGQVQEQFAHFLAETPQYKNVKTTDSTANRMSDEALIEFFAEKLR